MWEGFALAEDFKEVGRDLAGFGAVIAGVGAALYAGQSTHAYRGVLVVGLWLFAIGVAVWLLGKISEGIGRNRMRWLRRRVVVQARASVHDLYLDITNEGAEAEFEVEMRSAMTHAIEVHPHSWRAKWEGESADRTPILRGQTKSALIATWNAREYAAAVVEDRAQVTDWQFHTPREDIGVTTAKPDKTQMHTMLAHGTLYRVRPAARRNFYLKIEYGLADERYMTCGLVHYRGPSLKDRRKRLTKPLVRAFRWVWAKVGW